MHADATLIDEIVKRVLSELGARGPSAPSSPPANAGGPPTTRTVAIDAVIVTREILETGVGSASRVQLPPRAITTPSARDFLRERRIEVVSDSVEVDRVPAARCLIFVTCTTPQATAAVDAVHSTGVLAEHRLLGTAFEAAAEATSALCRGAADRIIVITLEPELVACLANRNDRVRGVALRDVGMLAQLQASMQPNLLAIDPAGRSAFELSRLSKAIVSLPNGSPT